MHKITLLILCLMLTACAGKMATPQQIAAVACPPVQDALAMLAVPGVVDPKLQVELTVATPIVDTVCAAGATITAVDLQHLATDGLPVVQKVVNQIPTISQDDLRRINVGFALAQAELSRFNQGVAVAK